MLISSFSAMVHSGHGVLITLPNK